MALYYDFSTKETFWMVKLLLPGRNVGKQRYSVSMKEQLRFLYNGYLPRERAEAKAIACLADGLSRKAIPVTPDHIEVAETVKGSVSDLPQGKPQAVCYYNFAWEEPIWIVKIRLHVPDNWRESWKQLKQVRFAYNGRWCDRSVAESRAVSCLINNLPRSLKKNMITVVGAEKCFFKDARQDERYGL